MTDRAPAYHGEHRNGLVIQHLLLQVREILENPDAYAAAAGPAAEETAEDAPKAEEEKPAEEEEEEEDDDMGFSLFD